MSRSEIELAPVRDHKHQALNVFLGEWRAEGQSYGSSHQPVEDPIREAPLIVGAALTPASGTPGSISSFRTNAR